MEPVFEPAVAEMSHPVIARAALSHRRARHCRARMVLIVFGDACLSGIVRAAKADRL
jgi:hypothetical protein